MSALPIKEDAAAYAEAMFLQALGAEKAAEREYKSCELVLRHTMTMLDEAEDKHNAAQDEVEKWRKALKEAGGNPFEVEERR